MVNLVLVSHSRGLAEAVTGLARQMSSDEVRIIPTGGVGENRDEFGTDAVQILEAIQDVFTSDGVLVLMDLGSAILSTEMALDLLPEEMRDLIKVCPAPLIEGAVAAGVQASLGSDLETVFREAMAALQPKQEQLGYMPSDEMSISMAAEVSEETETIRTEVELINPHGLHARPAAQFVKLASQFDADIRVLNETNGKGPVSARSLNAIATLGAVGGHSIQIMASGAQAQAAITALEEIVRSGFGEAQEEAKPSVETSPVAALGEAPADSNAFGAVKICEGIAIGPLKFFSKADLNVVEKHIENVPAELDRLKLAMAKVQQDIQAQRKDIEVRAGKNEAQIFDAHLLILQDPDLKTCVEKQIQDQQVNAEYAWDLCIREICESYLQLEDLYLQQRAVDVRSVGDQVLIELMGKAAQKPLTISEPVVLFAEDLTPFETSQLDLEKVLGIVTVLGGPTSHSAILARALGIPALAGVDPRLQATREGTRVVVDGFKGIFWVDPADEKLEQYQTQRENWIKEREELLSISANPAQMQDGKRIEVVANIGNVADARSAIKNGAEGVGLLRTEFLFLASDSAPDENAQYTHLCDIGKEMGSRPIIVRTLDIGGDKEVPYLQLPKEANPFLGLRATRLMLKEKELFQVQLRAILRAAIEYQYRIMFPMIASLWELDAAKAELERAHQSLQDQGIPHRWPIEIGIMVEIPSAAVLSKVLAPHVDFFSIGTNDLTQYTLAAERGNPNLSGYADGLHPALVNLIGEVCDNAHQAGKWVGVCGELAGDTAAIPVLIGLGVDELSMNPGSIPKSKAWIRALSYSTVKSLAIQAKSARDTQEVRSIAQEFLNENLISFSN